jgi:translocation and assembly module TamB
MSEDEKPPIPAEPALAASAPPLAAPQPRSRLRRFFLRHLPLAAATVAALLAVAAVGFYFVASSSVVENLVRKRLIVEIETLTGGRVEIAAFHWHLLRLEAEADGLVIHGLEDANDAPYARIAHLRVQISVLNLLSPQILLHSLEIDQPRLHFIVYPNGSTNQPQPRKPRKANKSAIDTLFKLRAGRVAVEQGLIDFESRATGFDNQDRYAPLDFSVSHLALAVGYAPATPTSAELYRIQLGATDLDLSRRLPKKNYHPVHGKIEATLDLERTRLWLRNARLTAHNWGSKDRVLEVNGVLDDFRHPRWQAKIAGDLDLSLIDPITGYPDVPEGIAHVNLIGGGQGGAFHLDGSVHAENASYTGKDVTARGINLDAWAHADQRRLLITQVLVRLRQGGEIAGFVDLSPWYTGSSPAVPSSSVSRDTTVRDVVPDIPMNGKVRADFRGVSVDAVLDMLCTPAYRRLGIDARLNGKATAEWANGENSSITITTALGLSPSRQTPAGEAPANGAIDATYTHRNGGVDLRKLELHLPASVLEAHGQLGVYPMTNPSGLSLDFHSRNLAEFDTALRVLGVKRMGRIGAAALPLVLAGEADFHGAWTDSLAKPHLAGDLKATRLSLEMPTDGNQSQFVYLDEIDAVGSYSPAQIAIQRAQLIRGKARVSLVGTLDAAPRPPAYGGNSTVHARLEIDKLNVADVQPFIATKENKKLPVTGLFDARVQVEGMLRAPSASGSLEMAGGSLYGEAFERLHAQGSLAGQTLKVGSARLGVAGGTFSASGSYDFKSKRFQADARGAGIDIARIGSIQRRGWDVNGKLNLALIAAGTVADPHLDGHAAISSLTAGGQRFGALTATVHSAANRTLNYNATSQMEGAGLTLRGQTQLGGGYPTQAQLDFSRFNVGVLLKMAHVKAFSGDSLLAGTITVNGPLAHVEQLRGEARLRELAMTLAGVRLQGVGGAHATLANGRIVLDPLHVTGDQTDMRMQGGLSLQGARQLDFAASGSVNLKLAETLDPDLTASGLTTFQVEAHGPMQHPNLQGRVDLRNGSLSLRDLSNGLSQMHGTLEFSQNRLDVKNLTAVSGGGQLNVGGYLAYERGIYANLSVTGNSVRVRYPQGVSSLVDAKLQLQGSQNNLLLGGEVVITRFSTSPDFDLASLAAQTSTAGTAITPADAPSNHVRLDVHIGSSPQLNFQNGFAKLAGGVNLRVRGTLASPTLLGRVSISEGSAMIAGTRYELERGDINFTNPVRIEPMIDLNATARVEDYDISLGLHGTPQKMSVIYRSDPPLPEADVVSLLALGRTASQQRLYTQQQEHAASTSADALLGGALNASMSSRVQKLFGASSVKIDPNYLGAFGNSTSRITVQEQFGRAVVLTYATSVNTTSQQLLQAEVSINRHLSLVLARDESGVLSMVIKNTRRYR